MDLDDIDWDGLRQTAIATSANAYVPYSDFPVGAAALTTSGAVVRGCNVENASYGLTLCAECGLVSDLVARAAGHLVAIVVVSRTGEDCPPCGRCRQLLVEHAADGAHIATAGGPIPLTDLLPDAFGAGRLGT